MYNFIKTYKKRINNHEFDLTKVIQYYPPADELSKQFNFDYYDLELKTAKLTEDDGSETNPNLNLENLLKGKEKHLCNLLMISFYYTILNEPLYKPIFYEYMDMPDGRLKITQVDNTTPPTYECLNEELKTLKQLLSIVNDSKVLNVRFWSKDPHLTEPTKSVGISTDDSREILDYAIKLKNKKINLIARRFPTLDELLKEDEDIYTIDQIDSLLRLIPVPQHTADSYRGELVQILNQYLRDEDVTGENDNNTNCTNRNALIIYSIVSAFNMIDDDKIKMKRADSMNSNLIRTAFSAEKVEKFLRIKISE